MKKRTGFLMGISLLVILVLGMALGTMAAGTTSVAVSKSSLNVGDALTVTVSGSQSSALKVKYNASALTLLSCNAAGYATTGNTITFSGTNATLKFKAAAGGKANIIVSSDTLGGSSTAVTIAEASKTDTTDTTQTTDATDNTTAAQNTQTVLTVDKTDYVISEKFSDSEIPKGFSKSEMEIHGSKYTEITNGVQVLVYLKPASNTSAAGSFYLYDVAKDSASVLNRIGSLQDYVILLSPEEKITDTMSASDVMVGDKKYSGYVLSGGDSDFAYFYGVDENKETGWFSYDTKEGTWQRANEKLISSTADTTTTTTAKGNLLTTLKSRLENVRNFAAIMIFLVVVLIIVIINLIIFHKKNNDEDDENEDDEDVFDLKKEIESKNAFENRKAEENRKKEKNIEDTVSKASRKDEKEEDVPPMKEVAEEDTEAGEDTGEDIGEETDGEDIDIENEKVGFFGKIRNRHKEDDEDIFPEEEDEETEEELQDEPTTKTSENANKDLDVIDFNNL